MDDPYVYENGTLINKLNITDYEKLRQAEADIGLLKLIDIDSVENKKFDITLIKALHTHIFEDIYIVGRVSLELFLLLKKNWFCLDVVLIILVFQ